MGNPESLLPHIPSAVWGENERKGRQRWKNGCTTARLTGIFPLVGCELCEWKPSRCRTRWNSKRSIDGFVKRLRYIFPVLLLYAHCHSITLHYAIYPKPGFLLPHRSLTNEIFPFITNQTTLTKDEKKALAFKGMQVNRSHQQQGLSTLSTAVHWQGWMLSRCFWKKEQWNNGTLFLCFLQRGIWSTFEKKVFSSLCRTSQFFLTVSKALSYARRLPNWVKRVRQRRTIWLEYWDWIHYVHLWVCQY